MPLLLESPIIETCPDSSNWRVSSLAHMHHNVVTFHAIIASCAETPIGFLSHQSLFLPTLGHGVLQRMCHPSSMAISARLHHSLPFIFCHNNLEVATLLSLYAALEGRAPLSPHLQDPFYHYTTIVFWCINWYCI